jgi:iron complex transport system substrate-binding protein
MRRPLALLALLLLALLTVACGDDEPAPAASSQGASSGFPREVRGVDDAVVRLPRAPRRVVALSGTNDLDALLALDAPPVMTGVQPAVAGGERLFEHQREALGGRQVEIVPADPPSVERVAAARPDLIVTTAFYEELVPRLREVAPTLVLSQFFALDVERDLRLVGQALGRERQADAAVRDMERRLAAARRSIGVARGTTAVAFSPSGEGDGGAFALVEGSLAERSLRRLGFRLPDELARARASGGTVRLSAERLRLLDADVVVGLSGASTRAELDDIVRSPLLRRTEAARAGRVAVLGVEPSIRAQLSTSLTVPRVVEDLAEAISALPPAAG